MKRMTKWLAVLALAVMVVTAFSGCSAGMKDGTYKAEFKDFDDNGWKDFVSITVEAGKITAVDYDSLNEAGQKKSEDEAYRGYMEPVANTYPAKFFKELEEDLLEQQDLKKVDAVAGATTSSVNFKVLALEAIKHARAGNSETAVVSE